MKTRHILLIEPDVILARLYQQAFEAAGYSVTHAASAQTALDCADTQRPDVVVLEIQLVAHSGVEFIYEFRSYVDWRNIPVIVHSMLPARELAANEVLHKHMGIELYLYKPATTLKQLIGAVHGAVALTSA